MNALWVSLGLLGAALAGPIDHPDLDTLPVAVAEAISAARARIESERDRGTLSGAAYGELGMIYQAHEMDLPAAQAYGEAAQLSPEDARWPYLRATIAASEGRFEDAAAGFSRTLQVNPQDLAARLRLARVRLQAGDPAGARVDLEGLFDAEPASRSMAAVHAQLGELELLQGRYASAADHLQRALELQPEADKIHYSLALALRGLEKIDRAREHLTLRGNREVVFEDPVFDAMRTLSRSYTYYISLGLAATRSKDFPAALDLMRRAVAADPTSPEARVHLARALEANGDLEAARRELLRVLENQPDHALARFNLGALEEIQGRDREAAAHYEAALASQPELFEARLLLANSLLRQRRFGPAAAAYDAALTLRPQRNELLLWRAVAEQAAGDCVRAVASLLQLVRRLPEDFEALLAYSRCAASCPHAEPSDRENALNAARNLYRLRPELTFVATLAMAEAGSGNFAAAVEHQAQALFLAARDGLDEQIPFLQQLMNRYRDGQPARKPWPDNHPLRHPRPITREDRL